MSEQVTIRDQSQLKAPNMPRHEREWLLLVLMERGEARYETVTLPDGKVDRSMTVAKTGGDGMGR